jgi:crossover junction endodeoxyribonuclease RuvC
MINRVIGIDPGLMETGWGVIESSGQRIKYISSGVIRTEASDPLHKRLLKIHIDLLEILDKYHPNTSGIEDTYVNVNSGSSLKLSHARASAMLTLAIRNCPVIEYPAKTVKKSLVGNGKAEKEQIQAMLVILLGGMLVKNKNEADALAIAICHAHHI